jgi:signal transduction histidine kinase/sugar lactone lactonase YvrE
MGFLLATLGLALGAVAPGSYASRPFSFLGPGLPPPRLPFRSFGADQGLSNLTILAMAQDREGFLWVGTENGLFRYDGNRFWKFSTQDGLPGLLIYAIACGPDGSVWVGTDRGLARRFRGRIQAVPGDAGQGIVTALEVGPDAQVWMGTGQGLFRAVPGAGTRAVPGWTFGPVHTLLWDQGTLWAGSERGLVERTPAGDLKRPGRNGGIGEDRVYALARDPRGRLWARTATRLWMRERASGAFQDLSRFVPPGVPSKGTSLFVDRAGRLWVPAKDRVAVLDGNVWSVCLPRHGIPTPWIDLIFQDSEGSLWVGGVGLYQVVGRGAWTYYDVQSGLPSNTVWTLHRDRRGTLWAGTNQGLARATPSGWRTLPGTEKQQTTSIAELPDGHLVASGAPSVLLEWDPRSLQVATRPMLLRQGDNCQGLGVDWKGRLWLAFRLSGLRVGEKRDGAWDFTAVDLPGATRDRSFSDLSADSAGGIWVTSQSALFRIGPEGTRRYAAPDGVLPEPFLLASLGRGEMLLSCRSTLGWMRFRQGARGLEILEKRQGWERRAPDQIYAAAQDVRGRMWLGGGQGLECLDGSASRGFGTGDGLVWSDISSKGLLAEPDGGLWIGTASGLAHYQEDPRAAALPPPPGKVLAASLGERPVDPFESAEIVVPHWEDDFRVQFAGLSYANPRKLEVETRLLGLEPRWRISEGRLLDFPGLRPGHYRFEVRARFDGGPWGDTAALAFRIRPPWWLAWPALALDGLFLGAGVWGLIRLRTSRLAARNRALEVHVAEATREILQHEANLERQAGDLARMNEELRALDEQKDQFLGIVAHDLRNPLGTISMAAEMLRDEGDPEEIRRTACMIQEESQGMSVLVGRLLDNAAIEAGKVTVEPVPMSLDAAVEQMLVRHGERARQKAIDLRAAPAAAGARIQGDPRCVLQILDNLVSNALKFSPSGTSVSLRVEVRGAETVLSVEDQGPGLTSQDRERLFSRYARLSARPTAGEKCTGLGLSIVKHLVDAQGARIWVESEPGRGAAFRVAFPSVP